MKMRYWAKLTVIFILLLFLTCPAFAEMQKAARVKFEGRKGWKLSNDKVEIIALEGGGHIVSAKLLGKNEPKINPFWIPHWKSMEPYEFKMDVHGKIYGKNMEGQLLSGIMGHNICLDFFGVPSKAEYEYGGITVHGEGPIVRWKLEKTWADDEEVGLTYSADLPKSMIHVERSLVLKKGEKVLRVEESVTNKGSFDRPFGWCQHVTMGAPFVERGVTLFDTPAMRSSTPPFDFSDTMRYKKDVEFRWPYAPGSHKETVIARVAADEEASSDYTTQLMDTNMEYGYFTAANPKKGLMMGYVWDREKFPWLDNWEENKGRTHKPWNGKEITRGMEFSTTPWTFTRRQTILQGEFFNTPTYKWIEAGETITTRYAAFFTAIPGDFRGTEMLRLNLNPDSISIERFNGEKIEIPCKEVRDTVE